MANQITGKIVVIGSTESIPSKDGSKTYNKREIVLDATKFDPYTGERGYENYPSFEFGGDKCAELDHFSAGEIVTISFDLQGTKYEKDGQTRFFTRIRGYKVERRNIQNTSPQVSQYTQQQDNDMPF